MKNKRRNHSAAFKAKVALAAAKGGGYIFRSDHSVAGNISGHTYDYIIKLVREYGQ